MNRPVDLQNEQFQALVVDRPDEGRFLVDRRVYSDPEIFDLELRAIFEGNWLYLCHESQLPKPHDFFTTHMGRQPVVLIRNGDGEINGFVNACAHRGAKLCRTARGNAKHLVCPYHGWVYDSNGRNVDIKDRDSGGYPPIFDQQSHDLTPIARLGVYKGFVFGSLNPNVQTLDDFLAGARGIIDLMADQSPDGLEVLPGVSTYTFNGNWKLQAENGVDGYHASTLHAVYFRVVMERLKQQRNDSIKAISVSDLASLKGGTYDLGSGHSAMWSEIPNAHDRPLNFMREEIESRLGEEHATWMINHMRNLLLYPNVFLMDQTSTQIRVFRPISVDKTEVKIYCVAPKGERPEARARRIRQYEDFFNASGMATPDDLIEFEACQQGFGAQVARWQEGFDRGFTRLQHGADSDGRKVGLQPEFSTTNTQDEVLFHGQYRQWLRNLAA